MFPPLIPDAGTFQLVDGALKVVPSSKTRKIKTIDHWCSAFNTFIAIYCKAHPSSIQDLMQYVETVRGLATEGGDWSYYDQNFRFAKEKYVHAYPWSVINWELRMKARERGKPFEGSSKKASDQGSQPFRKGGRSPPLGFCRKFHKGEHCPFPCKYDHKCYLCKSGSVHPAANCKTSLSNQNENTKTSSIPTVPRQNQIPAGPPPPPPHVFLRQSIRTC
jgi:hypothetical protein